MLWAGAAVVAQALQRVIHARGSEQRQRLHRRRLGLKRTVGNAVVHGTEVGQVEHFAHELAALRAHLAFNVIAVSKRKMHGNRLVADAHLQVATVVLQQQAKLLVQVGGKQIGSSERGFKATGSSHKAIAQLCGVGDFGGRVAFGVNAYKRVVGPHTLAEVFTIDKAAHALAQMLNAGGVERLDLRQSAVGVAVAAGRREGWAYAHEEYRFNSVGN